MASINKKLGPVTAYASAVAGGYTGTYDEFCRDQANFAKNATKVEKDREAAETAAGTATAAKTAAATSEKNAAASKTAAASSQVAAEAAKTAAEASMAEAAASEAAAKASETAAAASAASIDFRGMVVKDGMLCFEVEE